MPKKKFCDPRYLREHINYELEMITHTFSNIASGKLNQLEYNTHYESFAIHARNIYKFLTNDDGNAQACAYAKSFRAPKTADTMRIFNKINEQVIHLSNGRPFEKNEKVSLIDCDALYNWIVENIKLFEKDLKDEFKGVLKISKLEKFEGVTVASGTTIGSSSAVSAAVITTFDNAP